MASLGSTARRRNGPRASRAPTASTGTAKDRALGLLAVRWRSRDELRRRLLRAGFEPPEVESALADLEGVGLVDDARFAREVVREQAGRRLSGRRAIRDALRQKGVATETMEEALRETGDEAERALELAIRRAARMSGLTPEAAYRRLYGLLIRRGYDPDTAREACRGALAAASHPDGGADGV